MSKLWTSTEETKEKTFSVLLGLMFMSLFFGQALMNIIAVLFLIALLILRPRIRWIAPLWWLVAFAMWEIVSDYLGPHHGAGREDGGNAYHFLIMLLPLVLASIDYQRLLKYITVGAVSSAILMWLQALLGINYHAPPFRINWDGGALFHRTSGFNGRPWVAQFNHSIITLAILPYLKWKSARAWLLISALFTGILLPQIRAVLAAFIAGAGIQALFAKPSTDYRDITKRIIVVVILAAVAVVIVAALRPDFYRGLMTGNGRDMIFIASFEIFKEFPHTGIGGGEYFLQHYQEAWKSLGWDPRHYLAGIGHTHNDFLLLLVHHGWPALLLWLGFVIHSLVFVWKHGNQKERVVFISLVVMHHVAGLAETYLDYSNTTYAIALCYGLALHGPVRRYYETRLAEPTNG
ncbi:MAG: O-antigen ligase family protein [Gammaproteobacteria bacterium]|nr:O-antigen ligase family protein [Gammaproteobacteria bacterium]